MCTEHGTKSPEQRLNPGPRGPAVQAMGPEAHAWRRGLRFISGEVSLGNRRPELLITHPISKILGCSGLLVPWSVSVQACGLGRMEHGPYELSEGGLA